MKLCLIFSEWSQKNVQKSGDISVCVDPTSSLSLKSLKNLTTDTDQKIDLYRLINLL